jgi:hypothetical protein
MGYLFIPFLRQQILKRYYAGRVHKTCPFAGKGAVAGFAARNGCS